MISRSFKLRCTALLLVLLAALPVAAWSHAGLVTSEPGRRAVLTASPKVLRLCFNERVEAKFSSVSLTDKDGNPVTTGTPAADPEDPHCLVTSISKELGAGGYTVKYKVLSVDGHIVDYGYGFSVKAP